MKQAKIGPKKFLQLYSYVVSESETSSTWTSSKLRIVIVPFELQECSCITKYVDDKEGKITPEHQYATAVHHPKEEGSLLLTKS